VKEFYTWLEFDSDVRKIERWAKKQKIKNIFGVPRGGLPSAVSLSHQLGLPMVWDKNKITAETLVVDDISDSGKTLKRLLGRKKAKVATLYFEKLSKFKPDFYCRIKKEWVVFPWETKHSSKYDKTV